MAYVALGQTRMMSLPCITAAEKAQADADCRIPDIKGLGLTWGSSTRFPGVDACIVAQYPLCPVSIATYTPLTTVQPKGTVLTAAAPAPTPKLVSFLPPAPAPPLVRKPPYLVAPLKPPVAPPPTVPVAPPAPPEAKPLFGLGVGGLLLLLVVGGGAVYLLTRKKPPAKEAKAA